MVGSSAGGAGDGRWGASARAGAPPLRTRARQAWSALRVLLHDPEDTARVFEFMRALDPLGWRRLIEGLGRSEPGRALLAERPSLLALLGDRAWLESLPEGSFGGAYLRHMDRFGLDPSGLVQLQRDFDPAWREGDELERWWIDRGALVHDLWHVLTGCGADRLGEARLLSFTFAQVGGLANGALLLAVALRPPPQAWIPWWRELWCAFRAGQRACSLVPVAYESLLAQPLEAVRRGVAVQPLPPAASFLVELTAEPAAQAGASR